MNSIKYNFWEFEKYGVSGDTDLRECIGKSVDVNGCTILLGTSGYATVSINFKRYKVSKGDFIFLPYNMSFIPIQVSANFNIRYISISYDILENIAYNIAFDFWTVMYNSPVLNKVSSEQYELLLEWYKQTDWIIKHGDDDITEMLKNNLCNLFMAINCEIKRLGINEGNTYQKSKTWKLVEKFYMLLNRYHTKHRDVKFYADKLNVTPDYLYKLIYRSDNVTPKEMIDRQTIITIKTYLQNTDLSVKNIASELNFDDPSYMCRFFRRMTGVSPVKFREKRNK